MNVRIFVVLVLFGLCGLASAKTIYVPDDYAKIQWAVDNALDEDEEYLAHEKHISFFVLYNVRFRNMNSTNK